MDAANLRVLGIALYRAYPQWTFPIETLAPFIEDPTPQDQPITQQTILKIETPAGVEQVILEDLNPDDVVWTVQRAYCGLRLAAFLIKKGVDVPPTFYREFTTLFKKANDWTLGHVLHAKILEILEIADSAEYDRVESMLSAGPSFFFDPFSIQLCTTQDLGTILVPTQTLARAGLEAGSVFRLVVTIRPDRACYDLATMQKDQVTKRSWKKVLYLRANIMHGYSQAITTDRSVAAMACAQGSAMVFGRLPATLRDDFEVAMAAVTNCGPTLQHASTRLQSDRDIVTAAVAASGASIQFASDAIRGCKDIMLQAVKSFGAALQYAPDDLRADREIVLAAITGYGTALQYASPELRNDKYLVTSAIANNPWALEFASIRLKDDYDVVLAVVSRYGIMLKYASGRLRDHQVLVEAAVRNNSRAIMYASDRLRAQTKPAIIF